MTGVIGLVQWLIVDRAVNRNKPPPHHVGSAYLALVLIATVIAIAAVAAVSLLRA